MTPTIANSSPFIRQHAFFLHLIWIEATHSLPKLIASPAKKIVDCSLPNFWSTKLDRLLQAHQVPDLVPNHLVDGEPSKPSQLLHHIVLDTSCIGEQLQTVLVIGLMIQSIEGIEVLVDNLEGSIVHSSRTLLGPLASHLPPAPHSHSRS